MRWCCCQADCDSTGGYVSLGFVVCAQTEVVAVMKCVQVLAAVSAELFSPHILDVRSRACQVRSCCSVSSSDGPSHISLTRCLSLVNKLSKNGTVLQCACSHDLIPLEVESPCTDTSCKYAAWCVCGGATAAIHMIFDQSNYVMLYQTTIFRKFCLWFRGF